MTIEQQIATALTQSNKTLCVAESCTGGMLSERITAVPGSSAFFMGGIVAYDNAVKKTILKVPAALLKAKGAVSEDVALAMATSVRKLLKTDFAIAITGIAGPTGGSKKKPVGLVYIAIATKDESLCAHCQFTGERTTIRKDATTHALVLLTEFLPQI